MIRVIFILFTILTIISVIFTYQGVGLQSVESIKKEKNHIRCSSSHSSYSSGNYSGGYRSGK